MLVITAPRCVLSQTHRPAEARQVMGMAKEQRGKRTDVAAEGGGHAPSGGGKSTSSDLPWLTDRLTVRYSCEAENALYAVSLLNSHSLAPGTQHPAGCHLFTLMIGWGRRCRLTVQERLIPRAVQNFHTVPPNWTVLPLLHCEVEKRSVQLPFIRAVCVGPSVLPSPRRLKVLVFM